MEGRVFSAVCRGLHTRSPSVPHERVQFCLPTSGAENGPSHGLPVSVTADLPGLRAIPRGAEASAVLSETAAQGSTRGGFGAGKQNPKKGLFVPPNPREWGVIDVTAQF